MSLESYLKYMFNPNQLKKDEPLAYQLCCKDLGIDWDSIKKPSILQLSRYNDWVRTYYRVETELGGEGSVEFLYWR